MSLGEIATLPVAFALTTRLLGFSLTVQAFEQLRLGDSDRVLAPPGDALSKQLADKRVLLASLSLLAGALLLVTAEPLFLALGLPCAYAICLRYGGTFNGGSDYLTFVVGLPLLLGTLGGPRVTRGALLFIGVQLVLSYAVAGVAKLRSPEWRNGRALALLAERGHYAIPRFGKDLLKSPFSPLFAASVVLFECAAPLALLDPRATLAYLGLALVFHLAVALFLGLNRFVWAWLAAFPSALFLARALALL